MALAFKSAIQYPFSKPNFQRAVLIPSGISLASSLLCFALLALGLFKHLPLLQQLQTPGLTTQAPPDLLTSLTGDLMLFGGLGLIGAFLLMMPVCGYYWELVSTWHTHGLDAEAPTWQGRWKEYFLYGLHYTTAMVVLAIPLILASIPLFALVPFILVSFVLSAQEKTCGSVLRHMIPGIKYTAQHAGPILMAFYAGLLLSLLYMIPAQILSWTLIGGLVISQAAMVTLMHLLCQGYDLTPDLSIMVSSSSSEFESLVYDPVTLTDQDDLELLDSQQLLADMSLLPSEGIESRIHEAATPTDPNDLNLIDSDRLLSEMGLSSEMSDIPGNPPTQMELDSTQLETEPQLDRLPDSDPMHASPSPEEPKNTMVFQTMRDNRFAPITFQPKTNPWKR